MLLFGLFSYMMVNAAIAKRFEVAIEADTCWIREDVYIDSECSSIIMFMPWGIFYIAVMETPQWFSHKLAFSESILLALGGRLFDDSVSMGNILECVEIKI